MKDKLLIMYSGGLDCVGVTYLLLTDERYKDKYEVHLHHMHLINQERRAGAEKIAVEKTVNWFVDNGYVLSLTESAHDYSFMTGSFIWDMDIVYFMAGAITTASKKFKYCTIGSTATDVASNRNNRVGRMRRAELIFGSMWILDLKRTPQWIYPGREYTKEQLWNMMPQELRESTWSCRTPKNVNGELVSCGICPTCKEIKKFKEETKYDKIL